MKRYLLLLPLLICTISCSDKDLEKVAKNMVTVSNTIGQVQTDAIAANQLNLINDDVTAKILEVCRVVNTSGLQINSVIRSISQLTPADRMKIINLLTPINSALDPMNMPWIDKISDIGTRQGIIGGLTVMRSAFSTIQLTLAVE